MNFSLDFITVQVILSFLVAMARVQGFFITAPIFSKSSIPITIKIGISAVMCFTLYETIFSNATTLIPSNEIGLFAVIILETMIGAGLGFLINLIFDILATFGQMIGIQMAQSSDQVFNPASGGSTNPVASFYGDLAMLAFLICGGLYHSVLILKKSFKILPLASFHFDYAVIGENYIRIINDFFILGFKMLMPIIALMFIVDIFIAMFSKILPQASMFFLLTPAKILLFGFLGLFIVQTLYMNIEQFFTDGIYDVLDKLFWIEKRVGF